MAGISVDWYARLEQGRSVTPSVATVAALARVLKLTEAEHAHLLALTRPARQPAMAEEAVPETLRRMVEGLNQPAYVTGRRWDVLVWNSAADNLFGLSRRLPGERNILVCMLTDPAIRQLFGATWSGQAQRMLAQFRCTYDLCANEPAFVELHRRLQRESAEFDHWWNRHEIRERAAGEKLLMHPENGPMCFEHMSFQSNDEPGLRLAIYTPV